MAVIRASNRLGMGLSSPASATTEDTTAGYFNSTWVGSAVVIFGRPDTTGIGRFDFGTTISDFWFRFDQRNIGSPTLNNQPFVVFYAADLTPVIRVSLNVSGMPLIQTWNGTAWVTVVTGSTGGVLDSTTVRTFDLHVVTGASGSLALYINSTLMLAYSGAVPVAAVQFADIFSRISVNDTTKSGALSQIMVADTDTRALNLRSRRANGDGTYTDGTGNYTDIDDLPVNATTAKFFTATGKKATFTTAPLSAIGSTEVEALFINGFNRKGGVVINNVDGLLRISGGDYTAAMNSPNASLSPGVAKWDTNPATGTKFTEAAVNALEFGVETKA